MKSRIIVVLLLILSFCSIQSAQAAPKNVKKHALAKTLLAPVAVAKAAPKAALATVKVAGKSVFVTIGSGLFVLESGVDVAHLASDVLDKGVAAEGWKKNPFHYPNKLIGYGDTGLETAYQFLFKVQI